jgi:ABC-2 type transport system ATP-binding protein
MLQRVGVAQALLNEPELVFFDEPMSGLDPLGRRDLRLLLLRLRDRGCTIVFSSHILSDAETLCSRVAIVAQGKLVTTGRVSDMVAFELRGWELVADNVSNVLLEQLRPRVQSVIALGADRYTFELSPSNAPEPMLQEIAAAGGHVISLNPFRTTLEDYFVKAVSGSGARDATGMPS